MWYKIIIRMFPILLLSMLKPATADERMANYGGIDWSGSILTDFVQQVGNGTGGRDVAVSEMALGIQVAISEYLTADVIVLAEENLDALGFEEAFITYVPQPKGKVVFRVGQSALPFGVLHTHLISDPAIIEYVDIIAPAAAGAYATESFCLEAAFFMTDGLEGAVLKTVFTPVASFAVDVSARAMSDEQVDIDAALIMDGIADRFSVDIEGFGALRRESNTPLPWGMALGLAVMLSDRLETALRVDAIAASHAMAPEVSFALGGTRMLKGGLSIALEAGYVPEQEMGTLGIQFGVAF